jgi:hypothetical protein
MQRRLWLVAGAIAPVLAVTTSAATTVTRAARVSNTTPAATPFAQARAHVRRTTAARCRGHVVGDYLPEVRRTALL